MTNHQLGTKVKLIVFSLSLSALFSGCVGRTAPQANENSARTSAEHNDPFETINRSIYRFNSKVDQYVLKPIAKTYRKITPIPLRRG